MRDEMKAHATRAGLAAQRPNLTLHDARDALATLARSLVECASELDR